MEQPVARTTLLPWRLHLVWLEKRLGTAKCMLALKVVAT